MSTEVKDKKIQKIKDDLPAIHTATMLCVPYMNHDDANRLQMVNNHLRQALPLVNADIPYIITGYESSLLEYAQTFFVKAIDDGIVLNITPTTYTLAYNITNEQFENLKHLFYKTIDSKSVKSDLLANTFYLSNTMPTMKWFVKEGESFKKDQILAYDQSFIKLVTNPVSVLSDKQIDKNKPTIEDFIPYYKYGVTLNTAYMTYYGFNEQDAIVISETAAKKLTHIEKQYITIAIHKSAKLKPLYDGLPLPLPGTKLDGTKPLCEYTILHESTLTKSEKRYSPVKGIVVDVYYEIYPGYEIKDQSLIAYITKLNELIDYRKYKTLHNKKALTELQKSPSQHYPIVIKLTILQVKQAVVGDKISNRHGNKGVIGLIVPDEDMPHIKVKDKKIRIDIIPSHLSIPSRMNPGQLFEQYATKILHKVDAMIRQYMHKGSIKSAWDLYKFITLYFAQNDKHVSEKLNELYSFIETIDLGPEIYLSLLYQEIGHIVVIQRPYYGLKVEQLFELGNKLQVIEKEHVHVHDTQTLYPVNTGYQYWLKLEHTRDSKITGSTIGPYDSHGETKKGQRIGEMETWNMYAQDMDLVHEEFFTVRADHFESKLQWLGNILIDDKNIVEYLTHINSYIEDTDDMLEKYCRVLGIKLL